MKEISQRIVSSTLFKNFIIGVIIAAGVLVGIETHQPTLEAHHTLLKTLDIIVLLIFIIAIAATTNWLSRVNWCLSG